MRRGRKIAAAGPQPHQVGAEHCGQRLRWARLWREQSLEQLERTSGYCREVLRRVELGRMRCDLLLVEQLARALSVRRQWLAFGVGQVVRKESSATPTSGADEGDCAA